MSYNLPGPKSLEILKKGPSLFKYGAVYSQVAAKAEQAGFHPPPQMINARGGRVLCYR